MPGSGGGPVSDEGPGDPSASGSGGQAHAPGAGGGTTTPPSGPCDYPSSEIIDVSSPVQLASALASAKPGRMIRLANGSYSGDFLGTDSGSAAAPIVLCGEAGAVISANESNEDSFNLMGDHWILSGFSVEGGRRGVVLDGANFNRLADLTVRKTGQEAIHLRSSSSDNIVERCRIYDTGTETADFGEGIYIGSAISNWEKYTGSSSTPDRSNRNQILDNVIGPNVRAEHIDVKEGTEGGLIRGNSFDGAGISGQNYADSWIDIKGNDYVVELNTGKDAPEDGFQTHVVEDDWGHDIIFSGNVLAVDSPGYGINVSGKSTGVIVGCDNQVTGAASGLSNRQCAVIP